MSPEQKERYSRQILFEGIGEEGQRKLLAAHVAIVGCGALGSFQAEALARAGVGRLTIIDRDYVEPSNLQRQWLFEQSDADEATPKAAAAGRALARINASVSVAGVVDDLSPDNIEELLGAADLILDGTDNFETRYLINDFCVSRRTPWIYGAAVGSYGLLMPVLPGHACFRCVYPEPPPGMQPTCETAGVLGSVTAAIAAIQVASALRWIARGDVEPRITTVDVWTGSARSIEAPERDLECPACAKGEYPYLEGARRAPVSLCGRNAVQIHERRRPIDLHVLKLKLAPLGEVRANEFGLRFFCPPYEMTVFPDGRAIVKGSTDPAVARGLYAKYIGA